jgi:hypothetical protein
MVDAGLVGRVKAAAKDLSERLCFYAQEDGDKA